MPFPQIFIEGLLGARSCVGRFGGGRAGLAPALKVWEDTK